MHDSEEKREEKLEGREIRINGDGAFGAEKQHGKIYRWLDNFWYHHKWKTIIISFFAVVILVCTLQMCSKEKSGDISVLTVGPYGFMTEDSGLSDLKNCLGTYLPADYDGDGSKKVDVVYYTVYSQEQIQAYTEQDIFINTSNNSTEYNSFYSYLQTGETSILFLDPWLYEEMNGKLMNLSAVLDDMPEGAITTTDLEGKTVCYGVRLGDTALYRENIAMKKLPEDTVICLAAPLYMGGKSSNEEEFAKAKEYFSALVR
ncbi:MAG: hypothetical protein IJX39_03690 [Clostridia bacterium]|nr:hypothetical protein [Clostridia bacterium]